MPNRWIESDSGAVSIFLSDEVTVEEVDVGKNSWGNIINSADNKQNFYSRFETSVPLSCIIHLTRLF